VIAIGFDLGSFLKLVAETTTFLLVLITSGGISTVNSPKTNGMALLELAFANILPNKLSLLALLLLPEGVVDDDVLSRFYKEIGFARESDEEECYVRASPMFMFLAMISSISLTSACSPCR